MNIQPSASFIFACLTAIVAGVSPAAETTPSNLRIAIQLVEVPHFALTEMTDGTQTDGASLHQQTMVRVKNGGAKILDSNVLTTRSGQKAMLESHGEIIYPTEYQPPAFGCGQPTRAMIPDTGGIRKLLTPTAFDTCNAGVNIEVEPTLDENDQIIDLRIVPEWSRLDRIDTKLNHRDEWGDASIRMPIFEFWRANTCVTLMPGRFELVSVISPKDQAPAPAAARKILVFVRADIVPMLHTP